MQLEKESEIFIVIVTFNAMPWISRCLKSTEGFPVVIVDNSSCDGTINFVKQNYPKLKIFELKQNLGFGQANNLGISYALGLRAKYVFLLNQDAYLQRETIDILVKAQRKYCDYGILSPIHLNGTGLLLDKPFSGYLLFNSKEDLISDSILNKQKKEIYEVSFVNAAGWLISKECLDTVGGFDPIFFHYGEDNNYCQRVIYHGLKIGVVPDSYLLHDREKRGKNIPGGNEFNTLELKIKYGDINLDDVSELEYLTLKKRNMLLKKILKLQFKSVFSLRNEIRVLKSLSPQIKSSRKLNKTKGRLYLDTIEF